MLLVKDGTLRITGSDGSTRFDSDEGLFHTVTRDIKGTLSIGTVTVSATNHSSTTPYLLGSCHPDCTHAIGAVKFTLNNFAAGMAFDRWHTMLGGSIVWVMDGEAAFQNVVGSNQRNILQLLTYSLRVTAGQVFLDRQIFCTTIPSGVNFSFLSHSIQYNIKAGLFT